MSRRPLKSLHTLTASLTEITKAGPILSIQSYDALPESDAFRVVASHNPGQFTVEDYAASVKRVTDGKFEMVASTLRTVLDGHQPVVAMVIQPMLESKEYTDDSVKGMHVIRANVFTDEGDNMWKVTGEGANRRLVQMSDDNLDEILASRAARSKAVHASYVPDIAVANGDYVFYFDTKANEVRAGFGLHTDKGLTVIERESCELRHIATAQVVEAFVGSALKSDANEDVSLQIPSYKALATFDGGMATEYLNYARKLYGGTRFFSELEKWVGKKKAGGNEAINMRKD